MRSGRRRRRGLHDAVALRAAQLRPHMTNHHEARRHVLQHLARHLRLACAARRRQLRTRRFFRFVPFVFDAADDRVTRRRVGFAAVGSKRAMKPAAGFSGCLALFSLGFDCSSSSRSSNCSICRASFSDFRPNCMRCSLASSSFRCSISLSRERNCYCVVSCFRRNKCSVAPGSVLSTLPPEEGSDPEAS